MAIAKLTEENNNPPDDGLQVNTKITDEHQTASPHLDTTVIDSDINSSDTLLTEVAGYRFECTYFHHIRSEDDVSESVQTDVLAPYQQYSRINNYILKLTGELQDSTDPETRLTTVTGTATVVDVVIANVGDVFLGTIETGKTALFVVTSVNRLSMFKETSYEITFTMKNYNESDPEYMDLLSKVIVTYYYQENYLRLGTKPLLLTEEVKTKEELNELVYNLEHEYMGEFLEETIASIGLKTDVGLMFDGLLANFVSKVFVELPATFRTHDSSSSLSAGYSSKSIWDMLLYRSTKNNPYAVATADLTHTVGTKEMQFLHGLHHSKVEYILTPKETINNKEVKGYPTSFYMGDGNTYSSPFIPYNTLIPDLISTPSPVNVISPIPAVGFDSSYVLSTNWYHGGDELSTLEVLVDKYLKGEVVDAIMLQHVLDSVPEFKLLERYYLLPVIIFLAKVSMI